MIIGQAMAEETLTILRRKHIRKLGLLIAR